MKLQGIMDTPVDQLYRPGLGFEIDQRLLRKYGKRYFRLTERG